MSFTPTAFGTQPTALAPPQMVGWADYAPTLTQSGTVAANVTYSRFTMIGSLVFYQFELDPTANGGGSTIIAVTIPVPAAHSASFQAVGTFAVYDASAAAIYEGHARISGTTVVGIRDGTIAGIGAAPAFTLSSTNDFVTGSIFYEAA